MIRARPLVLALLPTLLLTAPGMAQVKVDPGALDQLVPPPDPKAKPAHPAAKPTHATKPTSKTTPKPAPKPAPPPKPVVPPAPPPGPTLPPPIVVPTRPTPPPPPVPVKPDAPGEVSKLPGNGVRVTFGPDSADLNPATDAALRGVAHAAAPTPATTLTITAYAGGTPDDPSTPRRLSLSRALAARAVMISEGVPSVRIFVRALGASAATLADGPTDRVDVTLATPPPAP